MCVRDMSCLSILYVLPWIWLTSEKTGNSTENDLRCRLNKARGQARPHALKLQFRGFKANGISEFLRIRSKKTSCDLIYMIIYAHSICMYIYTWHMYDHIWHTSIDRFDSLPQRHGRKFRTSSSISAKSKPRPRSRHRGHAQNTASHHICVYVYKYR